MRQLIGDELGNCPSVLTYLHLQPLPYISAHSFVTTFADCLRHLGGYEEGQSGAGLSVRTQLYPSANE